MATPLENKSGIEEIRNRFDNDVERFSNLTTGQITTVDAPLAMELITQAAIAASSPIKKMLDIGCGAGNNTLKLLQSVKKVDCDLVDISSKMLVRAQERVRSVTSGEVRTFQGDFRTIQLEEGRYNVVIAAAVLHHLRDDADWESAFRKIYSLIAPGGSLWITDFICHESEAIQSLMWKRYGDYLCSIGGDYFRDKVFEYTDKEDSPRPVTYQLELLRKVGFAHVEILHKNSCFAAYGAIKAH